MYKQTAAGLSVWANLRQKWPISYTITRTVLLIGCIVLAAYYLVMTFRVAMIDSYDFEPHWLAGAAVLKGLDPYDFVARSLGTIPYVYPPIFAIILAPIGRFSFETAKFIWYCLSFGFLMLSSLLSIRLLRLCNVNVIKNQELEMALMGFVVFLSYAAWTSARLGQFNALIFCLVVSSLVAAYTGRPALGGVLIGVAVAIKIIPAILVVYALWIGWRRYVLASVLTFIALQLISEIVFPGILMKYWFGILPSVHPMNDLINISLMNLVSHIVVPLPVWLRLLVYALSFAFLAVPFLFRSANRTTQLCVMSLLMLASNIVGPIVENHHLLWLILPVWLAMNLLRNRGGYKELIWLALACVFLSQPFRISRLLYPVLSVTQLPIALQGGAYALLGAILLYLLILFELAQQSNHAKHRT